MAKPSTVKRAAAKQGRKVVRPQLALFENPARVPEGGTAASRSGAGAGSRRRDRGSRRPAARRARPGPRATAESLAKKQREISVSEFFVKNRHLLGFDNPSKALLTTIKEAVDNSLDACEEAGILPELHIEVHDLALEARPGTRS